MTAESETETSETEETTEETETESTSSETDDGRLPDDHPVVKALAKANKEAEKLRLKVKEFEDRDKSEAEKAAEKAAEADQRAAQAESELARHQAAMKHGLSSDDLELLGTGTAEEIEQRAERLAQRIASATDAAPVVPASRNQGGGGAPADVDHEKLAEEIWGEQRI